MVEEWYGGVPFRYDRDGKQILEERVEAVPAIEYIKSVFLPHGYPDSVSRDYLEYQKWDTAQAFCSCITNHISSHSLLIGYGVGNKSATAGAALITWMWRDGLSMIGRILFAWQYGTRLDNNSRSWRLFADGLNDLAICVEILASSFPSAFILLACIGSLGKAIVSVAGGATRAALTQHQARRNNMADVSAKDGSQEQMVQLLALIVGLLMSPYLDEGSVPIWPLVALFCVVHMYCNYRAVACVVFDSLNEERARIVTAEFITNGKIMSPENVAAKEPIIWRPGCHKTFAIHMGARFSSLERRDRRLGEMMRSSSSQPYHIAIDVHARTATAQKQGTIYVVPNKGITKPQLLASFYHAVVLDMLLSQSVKAIVGPDDEQALWNEMVSHTDDQCLSCLISLSYTYCDQTFERLYGLLKKKGWNVDHVSLCVDDWRVVMKKTD